MALSSVAAQITSAGISAPSFSDVLAFLVAQYQGIFGSDVLLDASTQDGQFVAVIAQAITDVNSAAVAIYNAYSPSTAEDNALSQQVAINGLTRDIATNSTVDLTCTGVAGTILSSKTVQDQNGNQWVLPDSVVIPSGGSVTATATCSTLGAITALAGQTWTILTPTAGWQTVVSLSDAAVGQPVEDDAALRVRQANSVALPALSVIEGIYSSVSAVSGITRLQIYENDTDTTDSNSITSHSIAVVAEGGDAATIAAAIAAKKTPGVGTFGSTTETVTDSLGSRDIKFSRPTNVPIALAITLTALDGYTTLVGAQISQAVADYVNTRAIGEKVRYSRLYSPANLTGLPDGLTYEISALTVAGGGSGLGTSDINIAWDEVATCDPTNVVVTVS